MDTVIDGGDIVTIDGGGTVRILDWNSANYRANTHKLTLQHITFAHGHATRHDADRTRAAALLVRLLRRRRRSPADARRRPATSSTPTFLDNEAEKLGPDVGGGAIYLNGALDGVVVGLHLPQQLGLELRRHRQPQLRPRRLQLHLPGQRRARLRRQQQRRRRSAASSTRTTRTRSGSGGNAGAIGMDGGSDVTHTFCGDTFRSNSSGTGALGGALARTPDAAKQTTVIDRCLFDGNTGDSAGAAYFHNSTLTITASTFSNNVGKTGIGTIQADGTTFDFTNVTFYGNHATAGVGATLALFGGDGTLLNCTFAEQRVRRGQPCSGRPSSARPNLTIQNTHLRRQHRAEPRRPDAVPGRHHHGQRRHAVAGRPRERRRRRRPLRSRHLRGEPTRCSGRSADHGGPVPVALVGERQRGARARHRLPADRRARHAAEHVELHGGRGRGIELARGCRARRSWRKRPPTRRSG